MNNEEYNVEEADEIAAQTSASPAMEETSTQIVSDAPSAMADSPELEMKSGSETEPDDDSDNVDVNEVGDDTDTGDDWLKVASTGAEENDFTMSTGEASTAAKAEMGESSDAMEYDTEDIFRHLCFYLDTVKNARKNGMPVKEKQEKAINETFSEISKLIVANGGKIVDLDEPMLTHIVLDKRDDNRRVELMRRTAKPRRRHLVISDYIQACLDEGTLLDEDVFAP